MIYFECLPCAKYMTDVGPFVFEDGGGNIISSHSLATASVMSKHTTRARMIFGYIIGLSF